MWKRNKTERKSANSSNRSTFETSSTSVNVNRTETRTRQISSSYSIASEVTQRSLVGDTLTPSLPTRSLFDPHISPSISSSTQRLSLDARPFNPTTQRATEGYQSPFSRQLRPYSSARLSSVRNAVPISFTGSTASLPVRATASEVPTYNTNGLRRGKVLILNNVKFLEEKENRAGAEKDEKNLIELFKKMGFDVSSRRNLKKLKMLEEVKKFCSDKSLLKVDMSIVIVMSHGHNVKNNTVIRGGYTQIMGTDGQGLEIDDILNEFNSQKCSGMGGKPKIFIFQCCRGDMLERPHTDAVPMNVVKSHADMLIAYSTLPGFYSLRDPQKGSWYIQCICEVFQKHAANCDIESMLKIVDLELSNKHPDYKQTSSYESRGFKRCFFNPINRQL